MFSEPGKFTYRASSCLLLILGISFHDRVCAIAPETSAPVIAIDADRFDFGEVREGERPTHTFHISNRGSARLKFKAAYADCVCTVSKLKKRYLGPAETTELIVSVDTNHKHGISTSHVLVYSNDPKTPMLRVDVAMDVIAGAE